ncbi:RT0821/Lpp0805 family surface protein [Salinarimonas ramus]|uniref:Surface antigen domain-containing protein n=1 Tax=Salinarimonas ramus TaxID=690164 RepID=A0A917Q6F4_9HYPH|nr:RT0821/Lpp0805 family surface protein [Salinarimonas ramus]GGK30695.1 hypothetical protein GCM10011322_16570 [Salinarimonas ramus]
MGPLPHGLFETDHRAKATRGPEAARTLVVAGALVVALALGACAGAGPLATLSTGEPTTTGSITPLLPSADALTLGLAGGAFAEANAALMRALDPLGPGDAIAFADPASETRGTIAPAAPPHLEGALVCRRFAAETLRETAPPARYEGRACRIAAGRWRIEEARLAQAPSDSPAEAPLPAEALPADLMPRLPG